VPLARPIYHIVLFAVARAVVDEADLAPGHLEALLLIQLTLLGDLVECLAHRADAVGALEGHFDCFLVANVALVGISDEEHPSFGVVAAWLIRLTVKSDRFVKLRHEVLKLGLPVVMEGQGTHVRVLKEGTQACILAAEAVIKWQFIAIFVQNVLMNFSRAAAKAYEASCDGVILDEFKTVRGLVDHEVIAQDQAVDVLDRIAVLTSLSERLTDLDEPLHEGVSECALLQ